MPTLPLNQAEGLLMVMIEEEVQALENQAQRLVNEARTRRMMAVNAILESHQEKALFEGTLVVTLRTPEGRPEKLEWTT